MYIFLYTFLSNPAGKGTANLRVSETPSSKQKATSLIRKRSLKNNTVPKDLTIDIKEPFGENTQIGKTFDQIDFTFIIY